MNLPIFPLELVDGILSHLKMEDLLNCRLVSKSWNKFCLNYLRKSNCTVKLRSDQIKEYTDFIRSTRAPPILEIRVSQVPNTPLAPVAKNLDSLIDFTGPECIVALELHHFYDSDYSQFLPVLERLSPGLLSLHIKYDYGQPNLIFQQPDGIAEFKSKIQSMRFPKLEHLECGGWQWPNALSCPELVSPNLIGGCPSLQVLEYIKMGQNPVNIPIPFGGGLKSLSLSSYQSDLSSIVQQIQACQNKVTLNALTLDFRLLTSTEFSVAKNILQELSPHLKSLALSVASYFKTPIPCPMQVLRVLDIRDIYWLLIPDKSERWELMQSLRPALFPVLTDISFPLGLYFENNTGLKLDDSEVFRTVRKITPRLQHWGCHNNIGNFPKMSSAHIRKSWAHIFQVFPNAVIVSVQNSKKWEDFDLGEAIRCLVHCPQAVGVQELTVMNYEKDYVGRVFHVMDNPPRISITLDNCTIPGEVSRGLDANNFPTDLFAKLGIESSGFELTGSNLLPHKQILAATVQVDECYLKSLTKLRLLRGPYQPGERDCSGFALDFDPCSPCIPSDVQRILFVDLFAKHLPSLRSLELSPRMLSSDYFTMWKKISQIESRYPNWTVSATCQEKLSTIHYFVDSDAS